MVNMESLFNFDNKIFRILRKFCEMIYLNLLWLLFSLPIITIGASTTALYYATNKSLFHDRGYVWNEFWDSFKSNFKQSTICWLLMLGIYLLTIVDFWILYTLSPSGEKNIIIFIISILMIALVTFWAIFIFPYIARFEDPLKFVLKNSIVLALANILRSILLTLLLVVAILVCLLCLPLIALIPGGYMCCSVLIIEKIFQKIMSPEDIAAEEERNRTYKN